MMTEGAQSWSRIVRWSLVCRNTILTDRLRRMGPFGLDSLSADGIWVIGFGFDGGVVVGVGIDLEYNNITSG